MLVFTLTENQYHGDIYMSPFSDSLDKIGDRNPLSTLFVYWFYDVISVSTVRSYAASGEVNTPVTSWLITVITKTAACWTCEEEVEQTRPDSSNYEADAGQRVESSDACECLECLY